MPPEKGGVIKALSGECAEEDLVEEVTSELKPEGRIFRRYARQREGMCEGLEVRKNVMNLGS